MPVDTAQLEQSLLAMAARDAPGRAFCQAIAELARTGRFSELRPLLPAVLYDELETSYQADPAAFIARLKRPYDQAYFTGIVAERHALAILDQNVPHSDYLAYDLLTSAMESFEQAAALREPGNDDALLRWNTCARLIHSHGVKPRTEDLTEQFLE